MIDLSDFGAYPPLPFDGTAPDISRCVTVIPGVLGSEPGEGHEGSVLSLDIKASDGLDLPGQEEEGKERRGELATGLRATMVSGSSDCTARVWTVGFEEGKVDHRCRGVLRGHSGGVLDVKLSEDRIATG